MNQRVVFLFSINLFLSRYAEEDVSGFNFIECLCLKMKIYIVPSVNKKKNLLKVFILDLKANGHNLLLSDCHNSY